MFCTLAAGCGAGGDALGEPTIPGIFKWVPPPMTPEDQTAWLGVATEADYLDYKKSRNQPKIDKMFQSR